MNFLKIGLIITILGILTSSCKQFSHSEVRQTEYLCDEKSSPPLTVANIYSRNVRYRLIRWVNEEFMLKGYTPLERCKQVSSKIQKLASENKLKFISSGKKNGYYIICSASEVGGSCILDGQIVTLPSRIKNKEEANKSVTEFLNLRDGASGVITHSERAYIYDESGTLYVNVERFLQKAQGNPIN